MSKYDLCERIMVAGLEGFDGRMSADQQRAVFGRPLFGRKRITINCEGQGEIWAHWSAAFGTTTAGAGFTFEQVARFISNPQIRVQF